MSGLDDGIHAFRAAPERLDDEQRRKVGLAIDVLEALPEGVIESSEQLRRSVDALWEQQKAAAPG